MGNINGLEQPTACLLILFFFSLRDARFPTEKKKRRSNLKVQLPPLACFLDWRSSHWLERDSTFCRWASPLWSIIFNGNFIDQRSRANEVEGLCEGFRFKPNLVQQTKPTHKPSLSSPESLKMLFWWIGEATLHEAGEVYSMSLNAMRRKGYRWPWFINSSNSNFSM